MNKGTLVDPTSVWVPVVAWYVLCHYSRAVVLYLLPLLPLLYYCYYPKKAHHVKHLDSAREAVLTGLQRARTWYTKQYPPHLFLVGLYAYVAWITLLQLLAPRRVFTLFGWLIVARHAWWPRVASHPDARAIVAFLLPPLATSSTRLMQRALDFQQKYILRTAAAVVEMQEDEQEGRQTSDPFVFTIYEHQRQSPVPGSHTWHAMTLPLIERPAWADDRQCPVLPKHQFVLPAPVQLTTHENICREWTWVWVDEDWTPNDWIHGNAMWVPLAANAVNATPWAATRSRQWTRRAIIAYTCTLPNQKMAARARSISTLSSSSSSSTAASLHAPKQQPTSPQQRQKWSLPPIDTAQTPQTAQNAQSAQSAQTAATPAAMSPSSPRPSASSSHEYPRRAHPDASHSQASLFSQKTSTSTIYDHDGLPQPRRSASRSSSRRQAVWKSIVTK
ncbi:hypothetical protein BC940DRAFT_294447 [Gongronella butleri]|nr:hypothetical protein BC940DRAFT_294447 [Gongronella butleri]